MSCLCYNMLVGRKDRRLTIPIPVPYRSGLLLHILRLWVRILSPDTSGRLVIQFFILYIQPRAGKNGTPTRNRRSTGRHIKVIPRSAPRGGVGAHTYTPTTTRGQEVCVCGCRVTAKKSSYKSLAVEYPQYRLKAIQHDLGYSSS